MRSARSRRSLREVFSRWARRHLLVGLAWLVLATQVSSFAHLLVVRHAVCPEHGELIHPHDGEARSVADVIPLLGDALVGVAIHASDEATDDHVHCPLALHRRQTATLPPCASSIAPVRAAATRLLVVESSARPPPIALYQLAPKNSPPV